MKDKNITVYLEKELYDTLRKEAYRRSLENGKNVTLSKLIEEYIKQCLIPADTKIIESKQEVSKVKEQKGEQSNKFSFDDIQL